MEKLTVIGIGNRLRGDDAVGPLVIDRLLELDLPQLDLIDAGSDAIGILEYLSDRSRVWIIDACMMNRQPGDLVRFGADQVEMIIDHDPQNLHGLGLPEALKMARELEMVPEELIILGIQPGSIDFQVEISESVSHAVDRVVAQIQGAVQEVEENP